MSNIKLGLEIASFGTAETVGDLKRVQAALNQFKTAEKNVQRLTTLLGTNQAAARKLAADFNKTEGEMLDLIASFNALKRAGASNEQAFESLNKTLKISRDQFDRLSKINVSPKGLAQLNQTTKQVNAGFGAAEQGAKKASGGAVQLAAKIYLVIQAVQALARFAGPAYQLLIGQNDQLQNQLIGIQSTLAATNNVIVNGIEIQDPTQAIQALEGPVDDAIARIRAGSLELVGVTSNQLVDTFRIVATEAGGIGINLEQAADLSLDFAAALGTLGVPLNQAQQEIRSILQGTIDQNSIVAKSLGITNDQIRSLKEQGTLYETLREKLGAFRAGNKLAANTVSGITSNIQELIEQTTRLAGEELTDGLVLGLAEVFNFLTANQKAIADFVKTGVDVFSEIIKVVKETGDAIFNNLQDPALLLGPAFERLLDGLGDNLISLFQLLGAALTTLVAVAQPFLAIFVTLLDVVLETVGLFDQLKATFDRSNDAAEVYAETTARAANQALKAFEAQVKGEKNADKAKQEAITTIEDQIAALKRASLSGSANRESVRKQIEELENWQKRLQGSADDVELTSKATTALTNEIKAAEKEFKRLNDAAALENVTNQLDVYKDLEAGLISVEEAAQKNAFNSELFLEGKILEINAQIVALEQTKKEFEKLNDEEGARGVNDKIVALQKDRESSRLKIVKDRIAEQNRLENRAISETRKEQDKTLAVVSLAEQKRLTLINRTAQTEKQRALQNIESNRITLRSQLDANTAREKELAGITATGEEAKKLAKERAAARINGAKLANQLIDNERAAQAAAFAATVEQIDIERQAADNLSKDRIAGINREITAQKQRDATAKAAIDAQIQREEAYTQSLQNQQDLLVAQRSIRSAQLGLQEQRSQNEIDNINRAIELRKRLNDEENAPEVERVLRKQLSLLDAAGASEEQLIKRRLKQEQEIANIKAQQFQREQEAQQREIEFAQRKIELELRVAQIKAQAAENAAQAEVRAAQLAERRLQAEAASTRQQINLANQQLSAANQTGTDADQRAAQQRVNDLNRTLLDLELDLDGAREQTELQTQNVELVREQNAAQIEELSTKKQILEIDEQRLDIEQETAQAQFKAAESAAKMARELEKAEAAANGTRVQAREKGGPINRNQPYLVGERGPELFVSGVGGQIVSAAQLAAQMRPGAPANGGISSRGLEQRVDSLININRSLNAQILTLAGRQPIHTQNYTYYGSGGSSGADLRSENL